MLRKLAASLNPFARKPAPPAPSDEPPVDTHPHSFACECAPCTTETARLTAERLRVQGT